MQKINFPSRIVIVISSLGGGGAERVASLVASAWAERGRDVTLVTTYLSESEADFYPLSPLVKRIRLSNYACYNQRTIVYSVLRALTFRRLVVASQPDIVISFMDRINVIVLLCLLRSGLSVLVSERIDPFLQPLGIIWEMLRRFSYRYLASQIVVQTQNVVSKCEKSWHLFPALLQNPLSDNLPFPPNSLLDRPNRIICVGRMDKQKNHRLLLESWASLSDYYPTWSLRLIGDGALRSALLLAAEQLAIQDRVEWAGKVKNVWSEYQNAQIFVLPSRFEGFPNVLLEAMALGCACISTNCDSGPSEIIADGVNGLLCENDDVNAMSMALRELLDSPQLREYYGENAKNVREQFSLEAHLQGWENIFAQLS